MAAATWRSRTLAAALALLVQASFLLLVILSPSRPALPPSGLARETILLLHSLPRTAPATIDARGPARPKTRNAIPAIAPILPPSSVPSLAPPSGLAGFGQALFGCAPEHYADLTADQRAHCPKPDDGITRNDDRDLGIEKRSHAKYEARWKEQWTEDHWVPAPCLPTGPGVAQCLMDQSIAEHARAQAAWSKIAADEAAAQQANAPPIPPVSRKRGSAP